MIRRSLLSLAVTGLLTTLAPSPSTAAAPSLDHRRSVEVPRLQGDPDRDEIRIDGRLDEASWSRAARFDLEFEYQPGDNSPAPVATECLVLYSAHHLYVAFRASDPDPSQIRAHLMDRDAITTFVQDDHVGFQLDTFDDERRAYQFRINPLGVQADAIFSEIEGIEDFSFDLIWESKGRITAKGWEVEVAIPFQQLRFPGGAEPQTWGFDAFRSWPRDTRVRTSAHRTDRDRACVLCQADHITGLVALDSGRGLEIVPTITGLATEKREVATGEQIADEEDAEAGLTVRWGMTNDLTLSATIQPDFSQVEADAAQLDVNNRFALFFPERRPFFLEGIDVFATPIQAVFTRTVVDPSWGIKLTGKQGPHSFGLFAAEDEINSVLLPSSEATELGFLQQKVTSGVLRYRRDVGERSTLGALFAGREADDYSNGVAGLDGFFRLSATNTFRFQALASETEAPPELRSSVEPDMGSFGGHALFADFQHRSRDWTAQISWEDRGRGFRADSGFIPRTDLRTLTGLLIRTWRGAPGARWTQAQIGGRLFRGEDQSGDLAEESARIFANANGPLQSFAQIGAGTSREGFRGIVHDIDWLEATYLFQPSGMARISFDTRIGDEVDVASNRVAESTRVTSGIELKLGRRLNVAVDHTFHELSIPAGTIFRANLGQLRAIVHLNIRTFFRALVQATDVERDPSLFPFAVEPESEDVFTQLLFSWKLNPRTVVFAGTSDRRLGTSALDLTRTDRTYFLKLGYALTR